MAGQRIEVEAVDGGKFGAYMATPDAGSGPGILMMSEIFGLTPMILEYADMFAERGYLVLAPDVFWRQEPGFVAGYVSKKDRARASELNGGLDYDLAISDMAAAILMLRRMSECTGQVGVTGFCLGGTLAYLAAARLDPDATVAYYGTHIQNYLDDGYNISSPFMLHMGKKDHVVGKENIKRVCDALADIPNATVHLYNAGHGYTNPHLSEHYNAKLAEQTHQRTFEVFNRLF